MINGNHRNQIEYSYFTISIYIFQFHIFRKYFKKHFISELFLELNDYIFKILYQKM
jgi:hypothetical protein